MIDDLLPKLQKHSQFFARFDELPQGESLTIFNDHAPKTLYYQLLGERGDVFTWQYLDQGPEWWQVKITRRRTGENCETLGQIAAKDSRKAQVFNKYGLDFCCGGKQTVQEACTEKGVDLTRIGQELELPSAEKPIVGRYPNNGQEIDDHWNDAFWKPKTNTNASEKYGMKGIVVNAFGTYADGKSSKTVNHLHQHGNMIYH